MSNISITITDVAQQAGVSKSTISRYLNGHFESMSLATKANIAKVIAELDYQPNALARSLKQKHTKTIGAIVANILNPFTTSIIRGIEDHCNAAGFSLILCNADDNPDKEKEYLEILMAKQIDGLIISTTECNNDLLNKVNKKIPLVIIARKVLEVHSDTVTVDNEQGVSLAIDHLVALGHEHIAMFTLPFRSVNISPRLERVEGYKRALRRHGIDFRPELLIESECSEAAVTVHLQKLLHSSLDKPTAIFGGNDLMMMAILKCLKKLTYKIPDDVAVIGFDDWEWAELIDPPVTVVAQPTYTMGQKAADLVIHGIQRSKVLHSPSFVVYPPQLIIRKSCGE